MKAKKILSLVLVLAMVFSVLGGCSNNNNSSTGTDSSTTDNSASTDDTSTEDNDTTNTSGVSYPGTSGTDSVTINIGSEPPEMNTIISTDTVSHSLMRNTHEGLVKLDQEDNVMEGVAESWDVSDDGLEYVFHLRDNAVWENGDGITANDFYFAWSLLLDTSVASEYAYFAYIIKNAEAYYNGEVGIEEVGMEVVDDYTFKVTLENPTAYALSCFTFAVFNPVNEAFYNEVGADKYGTDADYILANGPYSVESWTHEDEFVMVKNETYWNAETVSIPKVICKMITDQNTMLNSFKAGDLDMISITTGNYSQQFVDEGYEVNHYNDGGSFYMQYNFENEVMSNVNLRKAISYAIDRETFISAVLQNSSEPATSLVPNGIAGLNGADFADSVGDLYPASGDAEQAKAYFDKALEELGMTAEEVAGKISIVGDTGDAVANMLAYLQEQLRTVLGVEITSEQVEFKTRLDKMKTGDFSIVLAGWGPDYNDPNTYLDMFVTGNGSNYGKYSSEAYDQLIASAAVETDAAARMDILKQAEEMLVEDAVLGNTYWRVRDYVVSEKLEGLVRTMSQDFTFTWATIAS